METSARTCVEPSSPRRAIRAEPSQDAQTAAERPMTQSLVSPTKAYPQLLGEGERGKHRKLLAVLEAIVLQRLQQPLEVVLQVLDEERPPPDELLDKAHVHQDARLGRLCREAAEE
jgi:hypothetical protein